MSNELLDAIQTHDIDRLAKLLVAGADPNEPGRSRYGSGGDLPPLHAAIGELFVDPGGSEPAGPIDAVVLLLRHGAKVKGWNMAKEGDPLLDAVMINSLDATRILLAAGADPNVLSDDGYSPLRYCAQEGFLETARLLLLCGATKTIDEWGGPGALTALGFAARGLHVGMVKLLLAHGADPQGQSVDRLTPLDCLQFAAASEVDAAAQARLSEIRLLLGAANTSAPT